jgi:hypothetical protein
MSNDPGHLPKALRLLELIDQEGEHAGIIGVIVMEEKKGVAFEVQISVKGDDSQAQGIDDGVRCVVGHGLLLGFAVYPSVVLPSLETWS